MRLLPALVFLLVVSPFVVAADPPTVSAEAKEKLLATIRERAEGMRTDEQGQYAKPYKAAVADLKAATDGKVVAAQGKTLPPTKGRPTYVFPTDAAKAEKVKELEKKLAEADPVVLAATKPAAFAPYMDVYAPGNTGQLLPPSSGTVVSVIDASSAVVTIGKVDVLLVGIDTSKTADGMKMLLKDVYYVPGNTKVGARTLMQLLPVKFTKDDTATLTGEKKPAVKK